MKTDKDVTINVTAKDGKPVEILFGKLPDPLPLHKRGSISSRGSCSPAIFSKAILFYFNN